MGIFDALLGGPAKKAAAQNSQAIQQGLAAGTSALDSGTNDALGLLGVRDGSNALAQTRDLYDRGRGALDSSYGQQQGYLGRIGDLYEPLAASGQSALGTRDDALGLNGADGMARAKQAFTSSLGYNAGLDEGLDGVMRLASARGNLAGGNTSRDLFNYGADYQNRQAGSFMDRLTGASQNLNTAIAGRAAGLGLQANASQAYGTGLAAMDETQGGRLAGLYSGGANAYLNRGAGIAGLNAQATNQTVESNNALSTAQMKASGNVLGLGANLLSGGNLAALAGIFK